MSDHQRQTSRALSAASSPGRPSPLSRPHWPWSTYTHRPSSSSNSVYASTSSTPGTQTWDPRSSMSSPSTFVSSSPLIQVGKRNSMISDPSEQMMAQEETSMRQWSFHAFEWVVRDVQKLKDFLERGEPTDLTVDVEAEAETDDFEILKESPVIGDGKFKLEIAKAPILDNGTNTVSPVSRNQPQSLSLYITSMMVDYTNTDYELSTSMFAAIKCQDDILGERGARAEWVWDHWHNGWVFRQESEVWECPLPSLSSLLENPRIRETDSFVICVQLHSPVGPFFPQQPSAYYVPRDLLDGLEASLDNPNTGDVRFICLERRVIQQDMNEAPPSSSNNMEPSSRVSSSPQPLTPQVVARKRVLYAHADILMRRSDYFATMLSSSFSEVVPGGQFPGERKLYTVLVEEADFVTMYWLLKFVYANWVLFRKDDDPREAVDGIGAGWSAKGISTPGAPDEWEWKAFSKGMAHDARNSSVVSDARSVTSAGSTVSNGDSPISRNKIVQSQTAATPSTSSPRSAPSSKSTSTSSRPAATQSRRTGQPSAPSGSSSLAVPPLASTSSATSRPSKNIPVPISPPGSTFANPSHYPISPRQRQRASASTVDPHPHPTPPPQPASALSMYQLAHRYAMPGLASLALEHIMSTIVPQSSFAVLLASTTWDELHSLVEDYVVDKWEEVSVSEEFERSCQEVANGEWGPEGGKTLMALFRRLKSPGAVA